MVKVAIDEARAGRRSSVDQVLNSAVVALRCWRCWVSGLTLTEATRPRATDLRALAAWYERLCADDRYANPPPPGTLDTLDAMEMRRSDVSADRVAFLRWAVCVAEELARCRRIAQSGKTEDAQSTARAVARLEVAMQAAMDHEPERRT